MKQKIVILLLSLLPIVGMCTETSVPNSFGEILKAAYEKPLDADSVYMFLRQLQDREQNASFFSLLEGEFDGVPVLIYKMQTDKYIKIYICTNPFVDRYPSTLLLWCDNTGWDVSNPGYNRGVSDWFEVSDGTIRTYKICDQWERIYIAIQDFAIENGRFILKDSGKEYIMTL